MRCWLPLPVPYRQQFVSTDFVCWMLVAFKNKLTAWMCVCVRSNVFRYFCLHLLAFNLKQFCDYEIQTTIGSTYATKHLLKEAQKSHTHFEVWACVYWERKARIKWWKWETQASEFSALSIFNDNSFNFGDYVKCRCYQQHNSLLCLYFDAKNGNDFFFSFNIHSLFCGRIFLTRFRVSTASCALFTLSLFEHNPIENIVNRFP